MSGGAEAARGLVGSGRVRGTLMVHIKYAYILPHTQTVRNTMYRLAADEIMAARQTSCVSRGFAGQRYGWAREGESRGLL